MSPSAAADPANGFEPKPVLPYVAKVGGQAAVVGLFVSTLQNALGKHNYGAMGVFTRTGGTIGFFGACLYSQSEGNRPLCHLVGI